MTKSSAVLFALFLDTIGIIAIYHVVNNGLMPMLGGILCANMIAICMALVVFDHFRRIDDVWSVITIKELSRSLAHAVDRLENEGVLFMVDGRIYDWVEWARNEHREQVGE